MALSGAGKHEYEAKFLSIDVAEILGHLGLAEVRYQENYREEWRWGDIAFDFDTWPGLPTFVEIEGPDEHSVRRAAASLELDYSRARFGSVHFSRQSKFPGAVWSPGRRGAACPAGSDSDRSDKDRSARRRSATAAAWWSAACRSCPDTSPIPAAAALR